MSPTDRAIPTPPADHTDAPHVRPEPQAPTAAADVPQVQWDEHGAPPVGDGVPDFHIGIGAVAGGAPGVLLTFAHVRWMFAPEDAEMLAAGLAEAARRARAHPDATPLPVVEAGVRA